LIFISFMAKDIEHLFLVICILRMVCLVHLAIY
jgi:hypothetical protein